VSPGHNDALLAGLILCAVAVLARGRPAVAVAICALAAAVKSPALIATAFVTWQWAYREHSWKRRVGVVVASFAITFAILEVLGRVTGVGWGWIRTTGTPGLVRSVLTPTTDLAVLAENVVRLFHFGPASAALLSTFRTLGYLAAAGLICWYLWRSRHRQVLLPLGLSLLVLVALGPVFQPWYLAWGLFCVAPVAAGRWRLLVICASTFATVALLPRFEPLVASTGLLGDVSGIAVALALAALAVPSVAERAAGLINRMLPTLAQLRLLPPPDEPAAVTPFETRPSASVAQRPRR
jgi:alpha-1,6-mannosyltransferase